MRKPRMTTRRWMVAIALMAVLIWGVLTTWRWQRLRKLANRYLEAADECVQVERDMLSDAQDREASIARDKREIAKLKSIDTSKSPGEAIEFTQFMVRFLEDKIRKDEESAAAYRKHAERMRPLKAEFESRARKYGEAAARPWMIDPEITLSGEEPR